MSLATAQKQGPPRPRKGPPCTVGVLLHTLPDAERDAFVAMLADRLTWGPKILASTVARETGVTVHQGTITRHRNRECACEPR